ncbi:hypothetical protein [Ilumatobacter sp.]|uniref:hypothetical protein n=1 Tax=Ilumatobacter sp. TaxID=1967498 RepID=UPI003751D851
MDDASQAALDAMSASPLFPFVGKLTVKPLGEPMARELQREGEGDRPCKSCGNNDRVWWSNQRWKVTAIRPTANPVGLFLETVDHIDFEHFDTTMAAEFGVLVMQMEGAIRSLTSVGRVHIHRWGDGSEHFHVWFQGRPAKQLELYGWGNVLWSQVLPPLPADEIDANHAVVVDRFHAVAGGIVADRAG